MSLDEQPPIAPGQPPILARNKPKTWASVRRKFALIVANRATPAPKSDAQTAVLQAESFCRPFIQNPAAKATDTKAAEPSTSESDSDRELEFEKLTKENSARNIEITSASYSTTPPTTGSRSKKKKKKNPDKIVRFIEEPYTIPDQEDDDSSSVEISRAGSSIRVVKESDDIL